MKTIEEAAKEELNMNLDVRESFKRGIEFAQRWIPVDEELPKENEPILFKMEGYIPVVGYMSSNKKFIDFSNKIGYYEATHWRPIEIK